MSLRIYLGIEPARCQTLEVLPKEIRYQRACRRV